VSPGQSTLPGSAPRRIRVAAILLLLAAAPAGAQGPESPEPRDPDLSTEGMRRLGPMLVKPGFLVKDAGYDDNLRFDAAKREGDYTVTLEPGADALFLAGSRGGIRIEQDWDYVAFRNNADLDHWNSTTRARGVLLLAPAVVSLEERYASVEERPNTEVDERVRRRENGLTAAVRAEPRDRLGLGASVAFGTYRFSSAEGGSEEIARNLNRRERTGTITGDYRILPKTKMTMEGSWQRMDFDDPSHGRGTNARSVLPGLKFDSSAAIQGWVKLGVTDVRAPDSPEQDYRGAVGEAAIGTRIWRSGRAKLEAARRLVVSTVPGNIYFIETTWSAAYEQFFSPRTSVELLYGRGLNGYSNAAASAGGPAPGTTREDRLIRYEMELKYRLGRQLALTAGVRRLVRDSNVDSLDRDRNLYTIGSTVEF